MTEAIAPTQRNLPGTRVVDMFDWDDQPIEDINGSFPTQQFISQTIRSDSEDVEAIITLPESSATDKDLWQYEHLRRFTSELNQLAVALDSVCTEESCPKMMAYPPSIFLCAAHKQPRECCAIDYILHTLDGTTALLNSNQWFPSRHQVPQESLKYFQPMARRLYRIFAHAYFNHPYQFAQFESENHLALRFTRFTQKFGLMPAALLTVPEDALTASGLEAIISQGPEATVPIPNN